MIQYAEVLSDTTVGGPGVILVAEVVASFQKRCVTSLLSDCRRPVQSRLARAGHFCWAFQNSSRLGRLP